MSVKNDGMKNKITPPMLRLAPSLERARIEAVEDMQGRCINDAVAAFPFSRQAGGLCSW